MKIALLFVLVATFLALAYGAPAAPEAEKKAVETLEPVGAKDEATTRNKRQYYTLGYGYPYAYASPYAYSAYSYPSAYYYPYSAYNYGYIYG